MVLQCFTPHYFINHLHYQACTGIKIPILTKQVHLLELFSYFQARMSDAVV